MSLETNKIGVVGLAVTGGTVTLYLDDGGTKALSSKNHRTAEIVDVVLEAVARKTVARINLEDYSMLGKLEQNSGGVLRFFRRAKDALKSAVGLGAISVPDTAQLSERAKKILASSGNALSIGTMKVGQIGHPGELGEGDTLVAVVNGQEIEGVEALVTHMEAAASSGNQKGLTRFMERLAAVAKERNHTAQELLRFMEKGDLPIADDGSIIAYKVLRSQETEIDGVTFDYVDPHSGKVSQKVGTRVQMPIASVDPDRRELCSNGLHIARRDYIRGFGGDAIMLVRVAPEDVISVPSYDGSKMRAMGYDILAKLPDEAAALLRSNQPMTPNTEAAKLLGAAIAGELPAPTIVIEVMEEYGKTLRMTVNGERHFGSVVTETKAPAVQALDHRADQVVKSTVTARAVKEKADGYVQAAMTGDLSAALSEPEPAPVIETPKPSVKVKNGATKNQARYDAEAEAVRLVQGGMSQREASRQTGVSARAIGRLLAGK